MLSVVIPAYNEQAVIAPTLRALAAALDAEAIDYELLVANDASTDGTLAVLESLAAELPRLRHVTNPGPLHGYGHAVRTGLAHFRGDAVAVVMADGADSPADLIAYWRAIEAGYDCAFGMRFGARSDVRGYPAAKRLANRLGNRLIARLTGHSYTDFTNGFKCFRRHIVEGAMQPLVCGDFNLTIEMSLKAALSGASYQVLPNSWVEREAGVSKFQLWKLMRLYLLTLVYVLLDAKLKAGGRRR
jgi:dolichol-phosphate mannosyltransferase